jgi:hypothetical protein
MLSEPQQEALRRWYSRPELLQRVRTLLAAEEYEELEGYLQRTSLFPLGRHSELPDYMLTADGEPLFPTNLDPRQDVELWEAGIAVGWEVVEEQLAFSRNEIQQRIGDQQSQEWDRFLRSVEERKRQRGLDPGD